MVKIRKSVKPGGFPWLMESPLVIMRHEQRFLFLLRHSRNTGRHGQYGYSSGKSCPGRVQFRISKQSLHFLIDSGRFKKPGKIGIRGKTIVCLKRYRRPALGKFCLLLLREHSPGGRYCRLDLLLLFQMVVSSKLQHFFCRDRTFKRGSCGTGLIGVDSIKHPGFDCFCRYRRWNRGRDRNTGGSRG